MRGFFCFAIGVAAGLLLAPDSGDKNLQKAREKIGEWGSKLEGQLTDDEDEDDRRR
jgi:gas vesicle protein